MSPKRLHFQPGKVRIATNFGDRNGDGIDETTPLVAVADGDVGLRQTTVEEALEEARVRSARGSRPEVTNEASRLATRFNRQQHPAQVNRYRIMQGQSASSLYGAQPRGVSVSGGAAVNLARTVRSEEWAEHYVRREYGRTNGRQLPAIALQQADGLAIVTDFESKLSDEGQGPRMSGDRFETIVENEFQHVLRQPLSTFSIDVDTASYSKMRQFLIENGTMPRPDSVRIEELINYFNYAYQPPAADSEDPFAAHVEVAACPWAPQHRLVRIGIKGKEYPVEDRPASNLVFLLDVSGSMDRPNKLPLLKRSMKKLVDQLGENDRVAIVVYAGAAGLVLDSTTADCKSDIMESLERLKAGGSTNGGDGIRLAYQTALDHFIKGGVNRVILCTDGDFNVGTTGTDQLVELAEKNAKTGVFLSVFGFGMGNHNDSMLEKDLKQRKRQLWIHRHRA